MGVEHDRWMTEAIRLAGEAVDRGDEPFGALLVVDAASVLEARNAINGDLAQAIEDSIDRLESEDDLWVGILSHTGPVFCAGADLHEQPAGEAQAQIDHFLFRRIGQVLLE